MNILIIGNGFDIAHNLPTKYTDFLNFLTVFREARITGGEMFFNTSNENWNKLDDEIKNLLDSSTKCQMIWKTPIEELHNLSNNNIWYNYFISVISNGNVGENWIDFETEISRMIKILHEIKNGNKPSKDIQVINNFLFSIDTDLKIDRLISFPEKCSIVSDALEKDLNKFIRCFEIYITEFIEKIPTSMISPDIEDLQLGDGDGVLSFNYTDTYGKLYTQDDYPDVDFIHGKACVGTDIHTNNMVLGIDEYLIGEEKNEDISFISFKKYFQRIHKQTGCNYKDWLQFMKAQYDGGNHNLNKVYIFGHSLDITDKDILNEIINSKYVITTIYYHDEETHRKQIANMVRILEQDNLISKVYSSSPKIIFTQQRKME